MNAAEIALMNTNPTFTDLCDRVRQARGTVNRAIADRNGLEAAEKVVEQALDAEEFAKDALDELIDRETQVES